MCHEAEKERDLIEEECDMLRNAYNDIRVLNVKITETSTRIIDELRTENEALKTWIQNAEAQRDAVTQIENISANTRLISAAPDLLAALISVIQIIDRKTNEFNKAKAAIVKAGWVNLSKTEI